MQEIQRMRTSKHPLTKDILLKIGLSGLIVVAALTSPFFLTAVAKAYFKDQTRKMAYARARRLRELERRKLISFKELPDGSVKIELSHRGQTLVRQYHLETMKLAKLKQWDRQWHIVLYDIPSYLKNARDAFREKLQQLGFYQLQKSVWVSPYPCLPEIEFLCAVFDISMESYVYHFTSTEIPREREVKKYFNLI